MGDIVLAPIYTIPLHNKKPLLRTGSLNKITALEQKKKTYFSDPKTKC